MLSESTLILIIVIVSLAVLLIGGRILFYLVLQIMPDKSIAAILDVVLCAATLYFWPIIETFIGLRSTIWPTMEIVVLWGLPAGFGFLLWLIANDPEPDAREMPVQLPRFLRNR